MKRYNHTIYLIPQGEFNDITGKYDEGVKVLKICNIYYNTTQAIGFDGNQITSNIQIELPDWININEHCKVILKKDLEEKVYFVKGLDIIDNYKGRRTFSIIYI